MVGRDDRVDDQGRAWAGSQLQVQIYVNRRRPELDAAICDALSALAGRETALRWVSPLEVDRFNEYRDSAFLERLGLARLSDSLRAFWPRNGPVWDGLAVVGGGTDNAVDGVVLVEGKSYPEEMHTTWDACERSERKIAAALDSACASLGIRRTAAWTEGLYQFANRLAHVHFFRDIAGVPAWLVMLLFTDDPHRPTSEQAWASELERAHHQLGLPDSVPFLAETVLPARDRGELLSRAVDVWGGLSN